MKKNLLLVSVLLILFSGCADKKAELYNKPALFWYQQIVKDIQDRDLESADSHYTSMASEHVASPLLEQALIILAQAHIEEEEYLLANFYIDTYIQRYGTFKKSEYARFLKVKANFLSFSYANRNQKLLLDTIEETRVFLNRYPNSPYRPLIETILVKMELGKYFLDREIQGLYDRTDRNTSATIYQEELENSPLKNAKMIDPKVPWYRYFFE